MFDEMVAAQGREPLHVFVDLREATMPSPAVSELWASWFAAHQKRLASVLLPATTEPISVATRIARFRSRTGPLITVVEQPDAFAAAIARVTTA